MTRAPWLDLAVLSHRISAPSRPPPGSNPKEKALTLLVQRTPRTSLWSSVPNEPLRTLPSTQLLPRCNKVPWISLLPPPCSILHSFNPTRAFNFCVHPFSWPRLFIYFPVHTCTYVHLPRRNKYPPRVHLTHTATGVIITPCFRTPVFRSHCTQLRSHRRY